jgi:hypothetical protein
MNALIPRLAEVGRVQEALAEAAASRDAKERETFWPALSSSLKTLTEVETALQLAEKIKGESSRDEALGALAARLIDFGEKERGLLVAERTVHTWFRVAALCGVAEKLAPAVPADLIASVLAAVRTTHAQRVLSSDFELEKQPLMGLAFRLAETSSETSLELVRAFPVIGPDGRLATRAAALTALWSRHPTRLPNDALREALEASQAVGDGPDRVRSLTQLLPHVSATDRQKLDDCMAGALAIVGELEAPEYQVRTLIDIAPNLSPVLIDEAVKLVDAFKRPPDRVEGLAGLAPYLPEPRRAATLEEAQQIAQKVKWNPRSARALVSLVAQLPETSQRDLLARSPPPWLLGRLAPRLPPELQSLVLQIAEKLDDREARVRVMSAVAPLLSEDQLRDVAEYAIEETEISLLEAIAHRLSAPVLQQAVDGLEKIESASDWADAVVALVPRMAELGYVKEAIESASMVDWQQTTFIGDRGCLRANALAGIAPHLADDVAGPLLSGALTEAMKIEGLYIRARAVATLAPLLRPPHDDLATRATASALAGLPHVSEPEQRAEALASLAPVLPDDLLAQALALTQALPRGGFVYYSLRANALAALAPRLATLRPAACHRLWTGTLHSLAASPRAELMWDIPALTPVIASIGGQRAVHDAVRAIFDAAVLWP